jgi:hypothetical protein
MRQGQFNRENVNLLGLFPRLAGLDDDPPMLFSDLGSSDGKNKNEAFLFPAQL